MLHVYTLFYLGVLQKGVAFNSMDDVAFLQKKFCKVGAILTSNTNYKGRFHFKINSYCNRKS